MELELHLDPDDAQRLRRLPLLARATRGPARAQRIIWHDGPGNALAARGLALARERNVWRLERLVPDDADGWPPAAPAPVLAQATELAELGADLPEPLAPVVAFAGRRQAFAVETDSGPVTLDLIRGTLRAVTAEQTASRVLLSGEPPAVLRLALALAEEVRAEVPVATLAGEGLAAARADTPVPRRLGVILADQIGVAEAFSRVLARLTEAVLYHAPAVAQDTGGPEPVHQMRVALRRLRSAMSLFRRTFDCPELHTAATALKELSARLGPTRDWDVFLAETMAGVSAMFPEEPRLAKLEAAARRRRRECHAALRDFLLSAAFRQLGIVLAWLAGTDCWYPVLPEGVDQPVSLQDFASGELDRRLHKLVAKDDLAGMAAPDQHALRLKAKRMRYAAEIFAPLYSGKAPRRFIRRLAEVQEELGLLNDRASAEKLLAELGGPQGRHAYAAGLVLGVAAAGAMTDVLPRATRRWEKFQRAAPFWG
jgi:triphosphatase